MEPFVGITLTLLLTAGMVAAAIFFGRRQAARFKEALKDDPDVEPVGWGTLRTRRAPEVTVRAAGGGKNNPTRWDATGRAPRIGARTSLHLSKEGLLGGLREIVGVKDVRTGDDDFDRTFTVRGGEPDAVRGILATDEVRATVRAFFDLPAWRFDLHVRANETGTVTARCPRQGFDVQQGKRVALATQRLLEVLEQHADDAPMREAMSTTAGGSATGAPVAVPIGGRAVPE